MHNKIKLLLLSAYLSFAATEANASETIAINPTSKAALLDGRCGNDEWEAATKIDLPAQVSIYLMHDKDYFYICAKGKAEDITVLDLYIDHTETGQLHKFHLSAQMGEKVLTGNGWERVSGKWDLKDYAGFWVPFSGLEDPENRSNPIWAKGTHRQVQVSRSKFPGDTWKMMFGVSAINHEGNRNSEFFYPDKATSTDKSTWRKFSFYE
ncbi:hypothetical protein [Microbulbifer litoralis]|uniref:hypothetical protein n=1 Tax=Microbulbifer litoralis TaxID=2933965 RepID=UPI0020288CB5|nr:hypothetical protein [Microbulbifer sp. GX H0434]